MGAPWCCEPCVQTVRVGAGRQAGPSGPSHCDRLVPQAENSERPGAEPWPRGDTRSHLAPSLHVNGADLPPGRTGLGRGVGLEQGLSPSPRARPVRAHRPLPCLSLRGSDRFLDLGPPGPGPEEVALPPLASGCPVPVVLRCCIQPLLRLRGTVSRVDSGPGRACCQVSPAPRTSFPQLWKDPGNSRAHPH